MAERTAEWVASPAPAPVGEAHAEWVAEAG